MLLQLEKTTPYISGQQRIDIVLKQEQNYLTEDSIHIVPLSDNVIYNENDKRPAMNYSHGENLKYLYEQTHQTFWNAVRERNDSLVYSEMPIDTYDHTYQRGLKRMRYSRYNKQFSFLCPVWIDTYWEDNFSFRITLERYNKNQLTILGRKIIKLSDSLQNYIGEYLNDNSDELLNINTDKNLATIKGCSMLSGNTNIVDISYIIRNILSRERPLMEFDSILCSTFRQNKLIAKQLLNFNFVFDFDDIASAFALATITPVVQLICYVEFGKLDENENFMPFEMRDIYTNYEIVPAYDITTHSYKYNVLDYLEDNKCTDIIYENKCVQPLCHWSLADNPDYLYNFYNGFSPFYKDSDASESSMSRNENSQYRQVWGSYYGTPVIGYDKYIEKMCNLNWAKNYKDLNYYEINNMFENFKEKMTKIPIPNDIYKQNENHSEIYDAIVDSFWMDWLKYNAYSVTKEETKIIMHDSGFLSSFEDIKITGMYFSFVIYENQSLNNVPIVDSSNITITVDSQVFQGKISIRRDNNSNICISLFLEDDATNAVRNKLIVGNYDSFSFTVASPIGNFATDTIEYYLTHIFVIRNCVILPSKFVFDKGVIPVKADTSLPESDEIKYVKANKNAYTYMHRYTGHLIPMFISIDDDHKYNMEWMPKQFSNKNDEVAKTINEGYIANKKQIYPSLDWFTVENLKFYENGILRNNTHYDTYPSYLEHAILTEYCWFNRSSALYLNTTYNATYIRDEEHPNYLTDNLAKELLGITIFGVPIYGFLKDIINKYIISLYDYTFDFEYLEPDNVDKILYNIEYKLR